MTKELDSPIRRHIKTLFDMQKAGRIARLFAIILLRRHRTNEVVGRRMDFSSDANANFEGLLEVNRGICMPQMAEKTSSDAPPSCAVSP